MDNQNQNQLVIYKCITCGAVYQNAYDLISEQIHADNRRVEKGEKVCYASGGHVWKRIQ